MIKTLQSNFQEFFMYLVNDLFSLFFGIFFGIKLFWTGDFGFEWIPKAFSAWSLAIASFWVVWAPRFWLLEK